MSSTTNGDDGVEVFWSAALLAGRGQCAIEQSLKNLEQSTALKKRVELVAIERQGDGMREVGAAGQLTEGLSLADIGVAEAAFQTFSRI